jgi:hypothetical protein
VTTNAICIACVRYKSKQCDIHVCTVILKVKIDRKLHVIHYGPMVRDHPTAAHAVADTHKSDAEQFGMCDRWNIDSV